MKQDVIGAANLDLFAQVALFLFVAAFVVIVVRAFKMSKKEVKEMQDMPLNDDSFIDAPGDVNG